MLTVFILSHFLEAVSVSDGIIPSLFLASAEMADEIPVPATLISLSKDKGHTLRVFVNTPSSFFSVCRLRIFQIFKFWFYFCLRIPSSTHFSPLTFSTLLRNLLCCIIQFHYSQVQLSTKQNTVEPSSLPLCHKDHLSFSFQ